MARAVLLKARLKTAADLSSGPGPACASFDEHNLASSPSLWHPSTQLKALRALSAEKELPLLLKHVKHVAIGELCHYSRPSYHFGPGVRILSFFSWLESDVRCRKSKCDEQRPKCELRMPPLVQTTRTKLIVVHRRPLPTPWYRVPLQRTATDQVS